MDSVGLDTVAHIEQHYITERHLSSAPLDWLQSNFISAGKLGNKSDKGGLYPPQTPGHGTKILLLNVGLAEPLKGKTVEQVMHSGQVLSYNLDNPNSRPVELVGKLPAPDGIDVANATQRMYWTNMGNPKDNDGSIMSARLDGSDVQIIIKPGEVHTPKQMIVYQQARQLYFCDREGLRVMRCGLDGANLETLYQSGDWKTEQAKAADATFWPVGIALSKKLGKIFWTQKGHSKANEGRIFSAGIDMPKDATAATRLDVEVVLGGLPECIDLEFDDEDGILYWTDRGEIPYGNTLNAKHLVGQTPEAEKAMGRGDLGAGSG